tara:strand:- start:3517 stop:4488 length:972 start_codon:yes stop_codon:yes gene_type:complete
VTARALFAGWGIQAKLQPLGSGRINDTWLVPDESVVLQRINQEVFHRPLQLMESVVRVVRHLNAGQSGWVPDLVPARSGAMFHEQGDGVYRIWRFVQGVHASAVRTVADEMVMRHAGWAFGRTQVLLRDLPPPRLPDAIDNFLRLGCYLDEFDREDATTLGDLPKALDAGRTLAEEFREPNGYIHGDCKIDNLLFNSEGGVAAVLDLDTVMWGHWAWDFGDLVRSAAAREGRVSLPRFEALTRGYLEGVGEVRDPGMLAAAPRYVALMLAVRFLTDHLRGDVYFKVHAHGDNLARGKVQLKLLRSMTEQADDLVRAAELAVRG